MSRDGSVTSVSIVTMAAVMGAVTVVVMAAMMMQLR